MIRSLCLFGLMVSLTALALGCASSTSTMLYRDLADMNWKKKTTCGVPITLEVPTYLKLTLIERQFLMNGGKFLTDELTKMPVAVHEVRQEVINTKKIFTVDLKRPAAGTWESTMALSKDQYFTNITHKGNDKTIEAIGTQVNALIKNVLPALAKGKVTTLVETTPALTPIENVVRMGLFKLDDLDLEVRVTQFLCESLDMRGPGMSPEPGAILPPIEILPDPKVKK